MDSPAQTEFVLSDYGKNWVKILVVKRDTEKHHVKELEVCTALTLNNHRDYIYEDNNDIIATDSQKNTVHVLAKQHGVKNIEKFALLLSNHFLRKYHHVVATKISIEEYPWKRIEINGEKHVHAFQFVRDCTRVCEVTQKRDAQPVVCSGIRDLRVLKTTQSAFNNFVADEFRTLPDTDDRILSTVVTANWWYNTSQGFCFDKAWDIVRATILETFAGPPDTGVSSASVQNTLYLGARTAISRIPQVDKVEITLPNKHYFDVDYTRFPKLDFTGSDNTQVYMAVDKPSGNIHAVIQRSKTSKL